MAAPVTLAAVNLVFWWSLRLRDSGERLGANAKARRALWLGVCLIAIGTVEFALSIFDFVSRNVIGADFIFGLFLLVFGGLTMAQAKRETPGNPVGEGEPETRTGKTGTS